MFCVVKQIEVPKTEDKYKTQLLSMDHATTLTTCLQAKFPRHLIIYLTLVPFSMFDLKAGLVIDNCVIDRVQYTCLTKAFRNCGC